MYGTPVPRELTASVGCCWCFWQGGWGGPQVFCVYKDPAGQEQERAKWEEREHPRKEGGPGWEGHLSVRLGLWERHRPA